MGYDKRAKSNTALSNLEKQIHFLFDQGLISNKKLLTNLEDIKFLKEYITELSEITFIPVENTTYF